MALKLDFLAIVCRPAILRIPILRTSIAISTSIIPAPRCMRCDVNFLKVKDTIYSCRLVSLTGMLNLPHEVRPVAFMKIVLAKFPVNTYVDGTIRGYATRGEKTYHIGIIYCCDRRISAHTCECINYLFTCILDTVGISIFEGDPARLPAFGIIATHWHSWINLTEGHHIITRSPSRFLPTTAM